MPGNYPEESIWGKSCWPTLTLYVGYAQKCYRQTAQHWSQLYCLFATT